jgi:hypothetical protein
LYKGGRASTSQINFSESIIVHRNLNAALGHPNETPECRLHNITIACVDNAAYHVRIAWRWATPNWRRQKRSSRFECAFYIFPHWKFGWRCHAFCGASQLPRFERSCRMALLVFGWRRLHCTHGTVLPAFHIAAGVLPPAVTT